MCKTIIRFSNGKEQSFENTSPLIDTEESRTVTLVNTLTSDLTDPLDFEMIEQVIWVKEQKVEGH